MTLSNRAGVYRENRETAATHIASVLGGPYIFDAIFVTAHFHVAYVSAFSEFLLIRIESVLVPVGGECTFTRAARNFSRVIQHQHEGRFDAAPSIVVTRVRRHEWAVRQAQDRCKRCRLFLMCLVPAVFPSTEKSRIIPCRV